MEDVVKPVCLYCKHKSEDGSLTCAAFPNGIPDQILRGDNDHAIPTLFQDNSIVFEKDIPNSSPVRE